MGLNQDDKNPRRQAGWLVWLLPICLVVTAVAASLAGEAGREWLRYEREAIVHGELWRLVTGHIVHLGRSHLILNLAGLLLVWYLVRDVLSSANWLIVLLMVIVGIDAGFWWLEPQLAWYVGLSGVLHGLLVAGIVAGLPDVRWENRILAVAVVAKLAYEQIVGPLPGSEESSGGDVVVAAHLYGALSGALVAAIILIRVRARRRI